MAYCLFTILTDHGSTNPHHNDNDNNNNNHEDSPKQYLLQEHPPALWLALSISVVWILRGALALITSCGARLSCAISLVLTGVYALLAIGFEIYQLFHSNNQAPPELLFWWWPLPPKIRPIYLMALAAIEFVRYLWLFHWIQTEDDWNAGSSSQDLGGGAGPTSHLSTASSRQSSPWWWNAVPSYRGTASSRTPDGAREPLLWSSEEDHPQSPHHRGTPHWSSTNESTRYHMNDGIGSPSGRSSTSTWWPFGRRSSVTGRSNNHARDDGSVEYASLNEDWASRSQEDPFWWTQEEE